MTARPIIFVSAASRELRSARQLVANTLELLGYDRDWQDIFSAEEGDLRGMLRRRIDASAGVVQLVGQCYGAEPRTPDEQFGRVSYTQYEALYAKRRGKKVWYLILDPDFKADPHDAELEELRALQTTYREKVREGGQLYHPLGSSDALEAKVLKLRDELGRLRKRGKQWAAAVVALLVLIVGLVVWVMHKQTQTQQNEEQTQQTVSALRDDVKEQGETIKKQSETIVQLVQAMGKARETGGARKQEQNEEHAYADVAKTKGINAQTLREEVPQYAEQVENSPETSTYEKAAAAFIRKDYSKAEGLGLSAADEARTADPPRTADAINALELAGWSAHEQIKYAGAVDHFRAAAALTDRRRDPLQWAQVQQWLGVALDLNGQFAASERILREVIEVYTKLRGPEDEATIGARYSLAATLEHAGRSAGTVDHTGKCQEAVAELRALLEIQERRLGRDDPETLTLHNNLGLSLSCAGNCAEAEKEERYAYTNEKRVLGLRKQVTLFSLNNLAMALDCQGKYAEAEENFRLALRLKEQLPELGPKNPYTLYTVYYLAICLQHQGKLEEAKQFADRAANVAEEVLQPNHPEAKKYRKLAQELSEPTAPAR